ncbi:MAG TPA: MoaD/ThiS family protein [Chloroflexia bacterium]|nr:MoaD/ThiS family protein [Chloroflexia bacterium]
MKVKVLLFASLREVVGSSQSAVELEPGARVEDAWARMASLYPRLAPHTGTIAFALNSAYTSAREALHDGDEVAFLPPVSGG